MISLISKAIGFFPLKEKIKETPQLPCNFPLQVISRENVSPFEEERAPSDEALFFLSEGAKGYANILTLHRENHKVLHVFIKYIRRFDQEPHDPSISISSQIVQYISHLTSDEEVEFARLQFCVANPKFFKKIASLTSYLGEQHIHPTFRKILRLNNHLQLPTFNIRSNFNPWLPQPCHFSHITRIIHKDTHTYLIHKSGSEGLITFQTLFQDGVLTGVFQEVTPIRYGNLLCIDEVLASFQEFGRSIRAKKIILEIEDTLSPLLHPTSQQYRRLSSDPLILELCRE